MPRTFNGTTDHISLGLGALNFAFGPGTIVAVLQVGSNSTDNDFFNVGTGVTWALFIPSATTKLELLLSGASQSSSFNVVPGDGWVLVAATKATGTSAVRFYKYNYNSGLWTIGNAGTLANSAVPAGSAELGQDVGGGSNFNGQMEIVGVWNAVLTDTQIQALPFRIKPWLTQVNPKGLWTLDAPVANQVIDWTDGKADQTAISGTTAYAGAAPNWNFGFDLGPLMPSGVMG